MARISLPRNIRTNKINNKFVLPIGAPAKSETNTSLGDAWRAGNPATPDTTDTRSDYEKRMEARLEQRLKDAASPERRQALADELDSAAAANQMSARARGGLSGGGGLLGAGTAAQGTEARRDARNKVLTLGDYDQKVISDEAALLGQLVDLGRNRRSEDRQSRLDEEARAREERANRRQDTLDSRADIEFYARLAELERANNTDYDGDGDKGVVGNALTGEGVSKAPVAPVDPTVAGGASIEDLSGRDQQAVANAVDSSDYLTFDQATEAGNELVYVDEDGRAYFRLGAGSNDMFWVWTNDEE